MQVAARLKARFVSVVLPVIILLALASTVSAAGSFRVTPILGDVPPDRQVPSFRIHNPASSPLTVQISAHDWQQSDNMDVVVPSDRLLVVPPLATIAPGDTQVVRVALKGERPENELSFRVHVQEVLPPPEPGFIGVRTAVKVDLPLFFAPADASRNIEWQASINEAGNLLVSAKNTGTRFTRLSKLSAYVDNDSLLAARSGPLYVLSGASRSWELPLAQAVVPGSSLRLLVETGRDKFEHAVTVR